jgi:hypothetical protein
MQNHPVCRGEELDQAITYPSSVSQHAPDQQSCSTDEQDTGSSVDERDFGKTSNPSSATTPIESQPSSGQKHHYYETVRPTSEDAATSRERPIKPWTPSILRIGPLVGLLAIVLAFCLTCASYAILHFSDGELVTSWRYQPSVYLAILTAVSNKSLAFATIHGTIITFWRAALRGTSLGDLHRNWVCTVLVPTPITSSGMEVLLTTLELRTLHLQSSHRRTPLQLASIRVPRSYLGGFRWAIAPARIFRPSRARRETCPLERLHHPRGMSRQSVKAPNVLDTF